MKKQLLTYVALPLMFIGTMAHAVPNNLFDAGETAQSAVIDALNERASNLTGLHVNKTYETLILNGAAGIKEVTDLNQLNQLFLGGVNFDGLTSSVSGSTHSLTSGANSLMNTDILGDISANDAMNFDIDAYLFMKENQLKNLTTEQLKNLLGKGISGKLSDEQIKSLTKNPEQLTGVLDSVANAHKQQRQIANGLTGMGIKKDGTGGSVSSNKSGVGTTSVLGPDGNRSDAFQGTGNGSMAQFAEAQQQFEDMRGKIEANAQLPQTQEELDKITVDQLAQIALFQGEIAKEMATQGLSKAWIRQEVAKQRMPKREEEAVKLINEGTTDIRSAINVTSILSIMSVESQNHATDVYATNLATYGAHINQRIGTSISQMPSAKGKQDEESENNGTQK